MKFYFIHRYQHQTFVFLFGFLMGLFIFKFIHESRNENLRKFSRRILSTKRPILFVGGVPRSGTTLMRAILDVHPDIRCGEETRVIPDFLHLLGQWENPGHQKLLNLAGITRNVLTDAASAFISEIILKHGPDSKLLCNKDPLSFNHILRLHEMFENSKFLLMIRDGRAVIHSMITRKVPVGGYNRSNPEQCLFMWNKNMARMFNECTTIGEEICHKVYYERLILHPREELEKIFKFIEIPFIEEVLEHEKFVDKKIRLSPKEFSTSQVKKKLNKDALKSWIGFYSKELIEKINRIAPMLKLLGYDTNSTIPEYDNLPSN